MLPPGLTRPLGQSDVCRSGREYGANSLANAALSTGFVVPT